MKTLLFLIPICALSACAVTTPTLGDAMAHNIKAHAIAPTPEQKSDTFIPADSTRQNLAREAYKKGEIKKLNSIQTSN